MLRPTFALCVALPCAALAQTPAPQNCQAPEHRQFDFWIGDWVVTDSSGARTLGSNVITLEESGCVIRERWTGGGGGTGQSMNYYDRTSRRWEQVWVASGGGVLKLVGAYDGTSMVLEGTSPGPGGVTVTNQVAWTLQPDGRVRQFWRASPDGGKTWQVSFDGWYRKRASR